MPSWYGCASVNWLRAITMLPHPFEGVEQKQVYVFQFGNDGPTQPVQQKRVSSAMLPRVLPDLMNRTRIENSGTYQITGKAWLGMETISGVEFSANAGRSGRPTRLTHMSEDPFAWVQWTVDWTAHEGPHTLLCRATDSNGNVQPLDL